MNKRYPSIIVLLFGIGFYFYQSTFLVRINDDDVDMYSFLSEGTITLTVFFLLSNLHRLQDNESVYHYLSLGFSLQFIALLTDALDELFEHPKLLTTISEDLFQVLGFVIVLIGISKWIEFSRGQTEELRKLATTDGLTGLFSRRYFQEKVSEEFHRKKRTNNDFSILMIDVDKFKNINDKYGHSVGDEVLQKVSGEIKSCIRKTDTIARWGGEEFIVLLVDADKNISSRISEKIRQRAEALVIVVGDDELKITVSIGTTLSSHTDDSTDNIINRADNLLYSAKQNGRNCVALDCS